MSSIHLCTYASSPDLLVPIKYVQMIVGDSSGEAIIRVSAFELLDLGDQDAPLSIEEAGGIRSVDQGGDGHLGRTIIA